MSRPLAIALDLGSTRFKRARLAVDQRLEDVGALATPALEGEGPIREGDPESWADVADRLLADACASTPARTPLGLASQRSTCLVWRVDDGVPMTPIVSWQDRRAAAWCDRHRQLAEEVRRLSGLPLSAHYVGPKLAAMQSVDAELRDALVAGAARIGTLDAWLGWRWSGGRVHRTDPSMAARTQLFDIERGEWSARLLELFGVPSLALPRIDHGHGPALELPGGRQLRATIADQASGALTMLPADGGALLIVLGTGAFAMRALGEGDTVDAGFLVAPLGGGTSRRVAEGAVNGAGPALSRFGAGPSPLPPDDALVDAFAVPDLAGLGAPHWRPRVGLTFSPAALRLGERDRRRVVLEGLLFRLRELVDGLDAEGRCERIVLAGGASAEPGLAAALSTLLERPVARLEQPEAVLLGAARLAAGLDPFATDTACAVPADPRVEWLRAKYQRWRRWLAELLAA